MNLDPLEKYFKPTDNVKLDATAKDRIRQELLMFMKNNPAGEKKSQKNWFGFVVANFSNFTFKTPTVVLAGIMLFLLVGGISVAQADFALPGDLLYPVKIGFNEKVKEALTFSDQDKLNLNINLANTRLQEAETLSQQHKITTGNVAQMNDNFQTHANKATDYINKTKNNKKTETAATHFEASLKAQSIIIGGLQKNNGHQLTDPLITSVEKAASKISHGGAENSDNKENKNKSNK